MYSEFSSFHDLLGRDSAAARHTKSASKGAAIMSPYNSKSTHKLKDSSARLQRMQTLTASKIP